MKGFSRSIRQKWFASKDNFQQFCDYVSYLTVASISIPAFEIVRKGWQTPQKSELTERKYVLVGNREITQKVEERIRYRLGEPTKPSWLFKRKFADIIKIKDPAEFEMLKNEKKPIRLYLCIPAQGGHSKDEFPLPIKPDELPKNIEQHIVVVKDTEDDPEDVNESVNRLKKVPGIELNFFQNTKVLQFSEDYNKDAEIGTQVTLRTVAIYLIAILLLAFRGKNKLKPAQIINKIK